ncbi:hypothetical protein NVP1052A_65 [Vibrio phage 1.052.A._10N.286.46.C3]|nr:hypothetical protein NVP1052A_65 [Vibrio phage 1.052.A._10N.286.46.C3]
MWCALVNNVFNGDVMNKNANELLMMFINDLYKSQTGRVSKKTAMAAMKFVNGDPELQRKVNIGDRKSILNHDLNSAD